MYKRYYDGYGTNGKTLAQDGGEVIIPKENVEEKNDLSQQNAREDISLISIENEKTVPQSEVASVLPSPKGFLDNIAIDDIILIGVILLVIKDNPDDSILIIILAAIFLFGLFDK